MLANILANAVKFTPSGEVVIHASCKPAMLEGAPSEGGAGKQLVRVSIRDTGIGISEESMKKLFQCFRQGSESMSRRYGGTGGASPQRTRAALRAGQGCAVCGDVSSCLCPAPESRCVNALRCRHSSYLVSCRGHKRGYSLGALGSASHTPPQAEFLVDCMV